MIYHRPGFFAGMSIAAGVGFDGEATPGAMRPLDRQKSKV
jgi:hypothetical protein